nr:hypothetical protein L203_04029 [Cryptococcus depauperatus CBS 7841]
MNANLLFGCVERDGSIAPTPSSVPSAPVQPCPRSATTPRCATRRLKRQIPSTTLDSRGQCITRCPLHNKSPDFTTRSRYLQDNRYADFIRHRCVTRHEPLILPTYTHRTLPQQCHTYPPLVTAAIALSTSHPCHLDIYAASPHHLDANHAPGRGLPDPRHDVSNHTAHPTQALLCGPTSLVITLSPGTLPGCRGNPLGVHHHWCSPLVTSMQRTSRRCYSLL